MVRGESKQRFIEATSELLREKGYTATGLSDVIGRSGAPKGSLYFHFPNGKDELFEAALDDASGKTCEAMKAALAGAPTVQAGVDLIITFLSGELSRSDFRAGCPIGTVAAEALHDAPRVVAGVQQAFDRYHGAIRDRLVRGGLKAKRADQLADFLLASIEGAILLSKAKRNLQPLTHCRREIALLLEREKVT